jgi:hypothetical protein
MASPNFNEPSLPLIGRCFFKSPSMSIIPREDPGIRLANLRTHMMASNKDIPSLQREVDDFGCRDARSSQEAGQPYQHEQSKNHLDESKRRRTETMSRGVAGLPVENISCISKEFGVIHFVNLRLNPIRDPSLFVLCAIWLLKF